MALRRGIARSPRLALAILLVAVLASSLCVGMTATVAMAAEHTGGCGSPSPVPKASCCGYATQPAQQAQTDVFFVVRPAVVSAPAELEAHLAQIGTALPEGAGSPPTPLRL